MLRDKVNRKPQSEHDALITIENALIAIRRSQRRRSLAKRAFRDGDKYGGTSRIGNTALFEVLDAIEAGEESGVPVGVSAIAEALSVAQPRASKLVAKAVDAGLVRREADQADGRRALLVRTDPGRALCEEVHRARRRAFADAMADWSPRDRASFARLLSRFVADYDQNPGTGPQDPSPSSVREK